MNLTQHVLDDIRNNYRKIKDYGDRTLRQISSDDHIIWQPNEEVNSIATIVQHLHGNMISRWTDFFDTDGEKASRDRDKEFAALENMDMDKLMQLWNEGWGRVFNTTEGIKVEDMSRLITIRGEEHTVVQALNRQFLHYTMHVGQLIHIVKMLETEWRALTIPRKR